MAAYPKRGQRPKWGIIEINGQEEGIVQIAEASILFGMFQGIILDMGPLWFNNNQIEEKSQLFFKELGQQFPLRFGRKRRIMPLLTKSKLYHDLMVENGFIPRKDSSYETIWLDLTQTEEILRRNLKQKWRNQLNRAEKQNLSFQVDVTGNSLPEFLVNYYSDFHTKNYRNIRPKDVPDFFAMFARADNAVLCHAKSGQKIEASALLFCHGCSATYQIGYVSDTGRPLSANYFLLWEAVKYLKNNNIKDFDLGGINAYDAKGVQHFKEGLNGEKISFEGIYS